MSLSSQKHLFRGVIILINALWYHRNVLVHNGGSSQPHEVIQKKKLVTYLFRQWVSPLFLISQIAESQSLISTNSRLGSHH